MPMAQRALALLGVVLFCTEALCQRIFEEPVLIGETMQLTAPDDALLRLHHEYGWNFVCDVSQVNHQRAHRFHLQSPMLKFLLDDLCDTFGYSWDYSAKLDIFMFRPFPDLLTLAEQFSRDFLESEAIARMERPSINKLLQKLPPHLPPYVQMPFFFPRFAKPEFGWLRIRDLPRRYALQLLKAVFGKTLDIVRADYEFDKGESERMKEAFLRSWKGPRPAAKGDMMMAIKRYGKVPKDVYYGQEDVQFAVQWKIRRPTPPKVGPCPSPPDLSKAKSPKDAVIMLDQYIETLRDYRRTLLSWALLTSKPRERWTGWIITISRKRFKHPADSFRP